MKSTQVPEDERSTVLVQRAGAELLRHEDVGEPMDLDELATKATAAEASTPSKAAKSRPPEQLLYPDGDEAFAAIGSSRSASSRYTLLQGLFNAPLSE